MSKRIGRWSVVVWAAVGSVALTVAGAGGCASAAPAGAASDIAPLSGQGSRPGETPVASADGTVPVAALAAGPAAPGNPAAAAGSQRPVARIDTPRGQVLVSSDQLMRPLVEAHGLTILLQVVQLELAKDQAAANNLTVTPQELSAEREATLGKLFEQNDAENDKQIETFRKLNRPELVAKAETQKRKDRELLLNNFMEQQRISAAELELVLQTNAYLRKVAQSQIAGRIPEETLRQEFADKYGELARVRHIAFDRPQDVTEAKRRLAAGEPFEAVAKALSKNPATKALGGEVPPFAKSNTNIPQAFRDAAFRLKPGEVSEVVQVETAKGEPQYHLIRLEERVEPKLVKFEAVRDSLAWDLTERATTARMGQLRAVLGTAAREKLQILDPVMGEQFRKKIDDFDQKLKSADADRQRILSDIERRDAERAAAATRPAPPAPVVPVPPGPASPEKATPLGGPASGAAPAFGGGPAAPAAPRQPAAATSPAGVATRPAGSPN